MSQWKVGLKCDFLLLGKENDSNISKIVEYVEHSINCDCFVFFWSPSISLIFTLTVSQ